MSGSVDLRIVNIATTFGNVKRIRLINGRKVLCSRGRWYNG